MTATILVVDDEKNIRRTLEMLLTAEGHRVIEAGSGEDALAALARDRADVVILDVMLPGKSGIDTLREIRRDRPDAMVVMISGHANIATAVEATREGAFDFLEKPLTKERVLVAVRNALDRAQIGREVSELKSIDAGRHEMIGESAAIRRVREEIARAAPSAARILILGESGTGKELVARAIHEASPRRGRPFVKVNCAAIPEELIESELFGAVRGAFTGAVASRDGKFLQADGGTLFLDEVGDMSLRAQAKVLRALQEAEIERVGGNETIRVDVRVIAATNKDLPAQIREGRFREDLYFRLNVIPIAVPALAERRDDIARLASAFLERTRVENNRPPMRFAPEALEMLARQPWPGNVRELRNAVERLVIMARGAEIGPDDLRATGLLAAVDRGASAGSSMTPASSIPAASPSTSSCALPPEQILAAGGLAAARRRFEADCIREGLRAARGNVSEAARLLGIDRTNLHKKITAYGIDAPAGGPDVAGDEP